METQTTTLGVMPTFTAGTWKADKRTKVGKLITELTRCDDYTVQLGFTQVMRWNSETRKDELQPQEAFIVEANEAIHDIMFNELFANSNRYGNKNSYYATKLFFDIHYGDARCRYIQGTIVDENGKAQVVELNEYETVTPHRDWSEFLQEFRDGRQLGYMFAKIQQKATQEEARRLHEAEMEAIAQTQPLTKSSKRAIEICELWIAKPLPYPNPETTEQFLDNAIHFGLLEQLQRTIKTIGVISQDWHSDPHVIQYREAIAMVLGDIIRGSWSTRIPELLGTPIMKKYQDLFEYIG